MPLTTSEAKAAALIESLPWLKAFQGQIIVIKFGGNAMVDEALKKSFAADMVYLRQVGVLPVVVHGGGPQISAALAEKGIPSEFRGGLRVTSAEAIAVVRDVLTTQVGPQIAELIHAAGIPAQTLSGETGGLFLGTRRGTVVDGVAVDLGLVGDVTSVNPASVNAILKAGGIPVISSIAPDSAVPGQLLNVNADSAAASLAIALKAAKLVILTDVAGLYSDWPNRESLVSSIDVESLRTMIPQLESGMIPKMSACLDAVDGGVPKAAIIDGRVHHSILLEAFTAEGSGTEVTATAQKDTAVTEFTTDAVTEFTTDAVTEFTTDDWRARFGDAMMSTFAPPLAMLERGVGAHVWDVDGNRYLDFLAGIAVNALGHAHPVLVHAVSEQVATLAHVSNYFATPPQLELAERLRRLTGAGDAGRVFFTNSGAEAIEAALKLARLNRGDGRRTRILSLVNSFHGRTMGSLSLTGKSALRQDFEPLLPGIEHIETSIEALEAAMDDTVSALFVEPIKGEAGVIDLPDGYLERARELTTKFGALLILDEIQTGIGRTGSWFAFQQSGVIPDALALAKGIAGGVPIGALVTFGEASTLFKAGQHGSTFGGNPLATAAGNAVLGEIERAGLVKNAAVIGERLKKIVLDINSPLIGEIRGQGALVGLGLTKPLAAEIAATAFGKGLIINAPNATSIRIAPPLIIGEPHFKEFAALFTAALEAHS